MEKFKSVDELVSQLKPTNPVYCIRGHVLKKLLNSFKTILREKFCMQLKQTPTILY